MPDASAPRVKTEEEVRKEFFDMVWSRIDYWVGVGDSNVPEEYGSRERIEGFAHSFLALLDGATMFPGCDVVVSPHPEDKEFDEKNGENWFPPEGVDIGGALHEHLYSHPWPTNDSPRNPLNRPKG